MNIRHCHSTYTTEKLSALLKFDIYEVTNI